MSSNFYARSRRKKMNKNNKFSFTGLMVLFLLGIIPLYLQLNAHKYAPHHHDKNKEHRSSVYKKNQCYTRSSKKNRCHKRRDKVHAEGKIIFSNSQLPPTAKTLWNALYSKEAYRCRHTKNEQFRKNAIKTIYRQNPAHAQKLHKLFVLKKMIKQELKQTNLTLSKEYTLIADTPYSREYLESAITYGLENTPYNGRMRETIKSYFPSKKIITLLDAKRNLHEKVKPEIKTILDSFSIPYDKKQ